MRLKPLNAQLNTVQKDIVQAYNGHRLTPLLLDMEKVQS